LEMAQTAAKALWADKTAEREAERAGRAVDAAAAAVLEPIAREMLEEAKRLHARFLEKQWALCEIRDALGHTNALYGEIERLWVKGPTPEEVLQRSSMIQRSWKTAIQALKSDADSALPEA
jgi:hypothetical protein